MSYRRSFWTCLLGLIATSLALLSSSRLSGQDRPSATPDAPPATADVSDREARPRQTQLTMLSYVQTPTGAIGATHQATIRVRPKRTPGLRVGFFDDDVEGTGPMWRASGWTATTMSCLLLGVNPEQFEFTFDTGGGRVDGPSAGALTTIGVLAALCGDQVRDDAAMTGTINPDGTIGPVGGIPHKLDGAARAGKKLVLIPAGQRYELDSNTDQPVNVIARGRQLGIEVRPVANIFEAYQIMTGQPLPRPQPVDELRMPPRGDEKLQAITKSLLADFQAARNRFNSLSEEARRDREPTEGDELVKRAERALAEGSVAVAYQWAWEAVFDANTSLQAATLDEVVAGQGLSAALDQLKATATNQQQFEALRDRLLAFEPRTASELMSLASAWSGLAVAWGANAQANQQVRQLAAKLNENTPDDDELLNPIYQAAFDFSVSGTYLDSSRDALDLGIGFGRSPMPDPARVEVMANLIRRAADANLALFESVVVAPLAEEVDVSLRTMRARFMTWDRDFREAILARNGMWTLERDILDPADRHAMILGASLNAWANSTLCIAKHYGLSAVLDEDGTVTEFRRQSALAEMFELSQDRASELVGLVQIEEPVGSLALIQNARILRHRTPPEQVVGLFYNWSAAAEAQILANLTGHFGTMVSGELKKSGRSLELLRLWDLPVR